MTVPAHPHAETADRQLALRSPDRAPQQRHFAHHRSPVGHGHPVTRSEIAHAPAGAKILAVDADERPPRSLLIGGEPLANRA